MLLQQQLAQAGASHIQWVRLVQLDEAEGMREAAQDSGARGGSTLPLGGRKPEQRHLQKKRQGLMD